jgi:hypothetical protein
MIASIKRKPAELLNRVIAYLYDGDLVRRGYLGPQPEPDIQGVQFKDIKQVEIRAREYKEGQGE